MTRAYVFPGQGSQKVGMGKALAEAFAPARDVFEAVDEALSQKLSKLMWEGPEGDLTLTANAQPAIMACSLAVVAVLEKEGGLDLAADAHCVAGHSLGEYSALCAAGSLEIGETAHLLRERGEAMQAAVPAGKGAMAALLGASFEQAERAVAEGGKEGVVVIANDNAEGQIVISGDKAAVDAAVEAAKAAGVKRAMGLAVSAPFHSPLMRPAADVMAKALDGAQILPPRTPVVANVTASGVSDPEEIRKLLVEQVTARVRWRESVLKMRDMGVTELVEIGAGKVLSAMVKRIDKDLVARNVDTPEDVEAFLKDMG